MAELQKTNLVLVSAPLPADFEGSPQEFYEALVERLEIQSPVGTNFFIVGDVEPSSNQGPWLKDGNKWYVFDSEAGRYVPLNIDDSTAGLFTASTTEPSAPTGDEAQIWLRVSAGRVIGWYYWTGLVWRPGGNVSPSGTTADRPTDAVELEQFFDTDINTLLHWERGAWRTVSGTPGDVKFVTTPTLLDAIAANPGWIYLGASDQEYIGRVLGVASKDTGATPESSYTPGTGITGRTQGDITGEETHVLESDEIEQHTHLVGALTTLNSDNNVYFYRVDDGADITRPTPLPPNYAQVQGDNSPNGTKTGELPAPSTGTTLVTSRQLSISNSSLTGAAEAHENMQPTKFLWALTKQ